MSLERGSWDGSWRITNGMRRKGLDVSKKPGGGRGITKGMRRKGSGH